MPIDDHINYTCIRHQEKSIKSLSCWPTSQQREKKVKTDHTATTVTPSVH